ncbi:SPL family radical SAM protein [Alicyclobacillus dauci]|uniref:Radical SAM protein n=1 Tax=Alicyclobacillus dauci TaxID=1475485 RepID=A0ABY6Z8N8_9BACL|nr:radical SAM protein [Alicyclobacillus dauci]WAH38932.1 radical SAM protein [Alicyclobacillus dauci]
MVIIHAGHLWGKLRGASPAIYRKGVAMTARVHIQNTVPRRLLQPASGYLAGYDYSLNPYVGCVFACTYCYVRGMPVARFHQGDWGTYVDVKQIDPAKFLRELQRAREQGRVTIFMSSSTDPYQPQEARANNTRTILTTMAQHMDLVDFIFVQTRSPLVKRDVDVLQSLGDKVLVSMTLETDLETVRQRFTPFAPPLRKRTEALELLHDQGIPTQIAVAPILPASDAFAESIVGIADYVVIDDYFTGDGSGGRRTESLGIRAAYTDDEREQWYSPSAVSVIAKQFQSVFGENRVFFSQTGFLPPSAR